MNKYTQKSTLKVLSETLLEKPTSWYLQPFMLKKCVSVKDYKSTS